MNEVKPRSRDDGIGEEAIGRDRTRVGAAILGGATLAMIAAMFVHPVNIDPAPLIGPFGLSGIVHAIAILAQVSFLYGAWTLSRHQGLERVMPGLALVFAAAAVVAMVIAAAISMFVVPFAAAQGMVGVSPAQIAAMHAAAHGGATRIVVHGTALGASAMQGMAVWVAANRGFAQIAVALQSIAIILWALGWRGKAMRIAGIVVGLAVLGWQLSGSFAPEVHAMILVVTAEGAWLIAAAIILYRGGEARPSALPE
jgi:hypothetical protein